MRSIPRPLSIRLRQAALATLLACCNASWGAAHPWTDDTYTYYANRQPLQRVLSDFASSFSLSLQLSPQVQGHVSGKFNTATPAAFLDQIASVHGLQWFTHAGTLYVSRTSEMQTQTVMAGGGTIGAVRQALESLNVLDARFGWGELPEQGLALVSGPPAYLALVQRTMAALPLTAGGQQVAVFRLKYASVDDRTILYRDRQITTPGLANVLRNLISGQGSSGVHNALLSSVAPSQGTLTPAANTAGLDFSSQSSGLPGATTTASPQGSASGSLPQGSAPRSGAVAKTTEVRRLAPSIQADSRLNAIIVQDTADRIPLYKQLIEQLDVPAPLIEIEAMIIDINTTKLDELGISWGGRRGGTVAGFGNTTTVGDGNDLVLGAIQRGASVDPSSLVVSSGNYLINRIRALEQKGDATIHSRPSILTIENTGALLDLSETFYIRTVGERVATVTPITAGTTLRVTPRMVQRESDAVVQLDIDIEDGQIQETTVDTIPTVRRSVVSTQAMVGENQVLLIGGYNNQQRSSEVSKVPVLGSVPLLGMLFSNKTHNNQSRERMFMIKPRLVTLPNAAQLALEQLQSPDPAINPPIPAITPFGNQPAPAETEYWTHPPQPLSPPESTAPARVYPPLTPPETAPSSELSAW